MAMKVAGWDLCRACRSFNHGGCIVAGLFGVWSQQRKQHATGHQAASDCDAEGKRQAKRPADVEASSSSDVSDKLAVPN
jgi:hypothetical protein